MADQVEGVPQDKGPRPGGHVQGNRPAPDPADEANPAGFDVAIDLARTQRKQAEGTMQRGVPAAPKAPSTP